MQRVDKCIDDLTPEELAQWRQSVAARGKHGAFERSGNVLEALKQADMRDINVNLASDGTLEIKVNSEALVKHFIQLFESTNTPIIKSEGLQLNN